MNNKNINYLCSVNEAKLKEYLNDSLNNCGFFVAAASGKIGEINLIRKLYEVEQDVINDKNYNVNVFERYTDDGINFSASVSFIKKGISF